MYYLALKPFTVVHFQILLQGLFVIPAQAGILFSTHWIAASAEMTKLTSEH
jgi:hypothetical protein